MARSITQPVQAQEIFGTLNMNTSQAGKQPKQPVPLSPIGGAYLTNQASIRLEGGSFFIFTADTLAGSQWQVSRDPKFATVTWDYAVKGTNVGVDAHAVTPAFTVPADASSVGGWYWRVRFVSSAGEISPWSAAQNFKVDFAPSASAYLNVATSNVEIAHLFDRTTVAGSVPSCGIEFSKSASFATVDYTMGLATTATGQTSTLAASNLPGLTGRTQAWYCRPYGVVGGTKIYGPITRLGAQVDIYPNATNTATTTGVTGSGTVPAAYSGEASVIAVGGGGGGGGTAYDGAGGGASGYIVEQQITVTGGQSYNYTVGDGGSAGSWTGYGGNGAATTMTIGGTTITANGGTGGAPSAYGAAGGVGGRNGGPGNQKNTRAPGGGGLYNLGGIGGNGSTGGKGGYGWGAGGGGGQRDQGSSGAGGGGGGFQIGPQAGNGQYTNVGNGGAGNAGCLIIKYLNW